MIAGGYFIGRVCFPLHMSTVVAIRDNTILAKVRGKTENDQQRFRNAHPARLRGSNWLHLESTTARLQLIQ